MAVRLSSSPSGAGIDTARSIVVASRHETGSRRRADIADIEIAKVSTFFTHPIERRRADDWVAHKSVIADALIVTHDQDDVRAVSSSMARSGDRDDCDCELEWIECVRHWRHGRFLIVSKKH